MILTREILYSDSCPMLQKTMVVYKCERLYEGKIYVGKTTRKLAQRIKEHLKNNTNSYIDKAFKKYGIENFDIEVIADANTEEELNLLEKFFIEFFDCKAPEGYNLTDGGEGACGRIVSKITRKKMAASAKKRTGYSHPQTYKTRQKIVEALKGRKLSKEIRDKFSVSNKSKRLTLCVETQEIFESIKKAAEWAGVSRFAIQDVLRGKIKIAGGYHWQYATDKDKNIAPVAVSQKRPTICIEIQEIFESISAAAKWANISPSTIHDALLDKKFTAGGYHWQYADQKEEK